MTSLRTPAMRRTLAVTCGVAAIALSVGAGGASAATAPGKAVQPTAVSASLVRPLVDFGNSCSDVYVDAYGILHATCKERDGSPNNTSLNLNQHIGNNNGTLVANGVNFTETCIEIGGGVILDAECEGDGLSGPWYTVLNLNSWVDNTNGDLVWVA